MKSILIGLHGKAGSGKDTIGNLISNTFYIDDDTFCNPITLYSLATPLKSICSIIYSKDLDTFNDQSVKNKKDVRLNLSPREMMTSIGTDMFRKLDEDIWVKLANIRYDTAQLNGESLCIPDVRFDNEAIWIKSLGGIIVYVDRPDLDTSHDLYNHSSEQGLSTHLYDYTLINDGTLDNLKESVYTFVKWLANRCSSKGVSSSLKW